MKKICKECGKTFPSRKRIDGKIRNLKNRTKCLDCMPFGTSVYSHSHLNKEDRYIKYRVRKAKNSRDCYHRQKLTGMTQWQVNDKRSAEKKLSLIKLIGGCQICGYQKIHNLTFHHVLSGEKEFELDKRNFKFSWEKMKKELLKCILVCNHCHGDIHYEHIDDKPYHIKLVEIIGPLKNWP